MDNMNGDWNDFEEGIRGSQSDYFSERRCLPYCCNCFKSKKVFWTKQRVVEYIINAVLLGLFFWFLLSL